MSVAAARPSAANPDVSDLLTRARAIGALARERAQQTESDRRVGDDMIERMRQADLFRVMQPRSYGGLEHGFDVFAQIVAAIASGCGSARRGLAPLPPPPGAHPPLFAKRRGTGLGGAAPPPPPA